MPRVIGNTLVPRNPVAKTLRNQRGGAHTESRSAVRQQKRQSLRQELDDWREELDFERRVSKR